MKTFIVLLCSCFVFTVQAQKHKYLFCDTLITLKSGVSVNITVCRDSANTQPLPVILVNSIYASKLIDRATAQIAAMRGYVGVVADTRGKRTSKNKIEPFEHEAEDAYETIDWISKQSWCNGKVGMYSASYLGFSQWAACKHLHPALKTIIPQVAVGIGIDYPMQNGVFSNYALRWLHFVTDNDTIDLRDFMNEHHWDSAYAKWYASGKSVRSLDSLEGRPNAIFQRWLSHPSYDDYWKKMTPQGDEFAKINIPVLTITGYYDDDQLGAMYYFGQHTLHNKNNRHYLVIGPYDHDGAQIMAPAKLSGYKIDSVAVMNMYSLMFKWFNYILKDSAKPAFLQDKINYEVMGRNEWKHVSSLDKMNNDTLTFYLSDSVLTNEKTDNNSSKNIQLNYLVRNDTDRMSEEINVLDSALYVNHHSLVYKSQPFEQDVTINGSFFGNIDAVLNKKDVDLNIQLYEQTTDGKYFKLNNTVFRASYAKDKTKRILLLPNKHNQISIDNTFFVSRYMQKGSRLIFIVSPNKDYNWEINYGTGKDVSQETIADGKTPLQLKIFSDSYVKIPVLK